MSTVTSTTDEDAVDALHYHIIKHLDECHGTPYCIDHFGLDKVEEYSLLKAYLNYLPWSISGTANISHTN